MVVDKIKYVWYCIDKTEMKGEINMVCYENECVGCPPERGCLGDACPNRNVPRYYCDKCGDECWPEELYSYDDEMWCRDCLTEELLKDIPKIRI